MTITDYIAILSLVLNVLFLPLFIWIWTTDRKVVILQATQITKDDLEKLYFKLDEIKKDFHDRLNLK